MNKKALMSSLLMASVLTSNEYKMWSSYYFNQKKLEGTAIYIPKRHKFKRKYKR